MTYAPADLLAVRRFLLSSTGLSGNAVGIVGDDAHAGGGYHIGNDGLAAAGRLTADYSKRESSRDRPGSNAASALDVGQWTGTVGAAKISWLAFNRALADACRRGDPRTRDVREVIYTLDGRAVSRFDRLGIRSSGDNSHLTHTHISFFRDSEGRRAQPDNILGLFQELIEGNGMTPTQDAEAHNTHDRVYALLTMEPYGAAPSVPIGDAIKAIAAGVVAIETRLDALAIGGVDQATLTAAVVAAMQDPAVQAAMVAAANQAEDS